MGCCQGGVSGASQGHKIPALPGLLSKDTLATNASTPPFYHKRTESHSETHCLQALRLRSCERNFPDQAEKPPVKLVVFDLDETLTLATFMPKGGVADLTSEKRAAVLEYSFESPFAVGSRLTKLRTMLEALTSGKDASGNTREHRKLAVLTKNESGVHAVVELLRLAELANLFSAIWIMPWEDDQCNGAYQDDTGEWIFFDPPCEDINDHKVDWLNDVVNNTSKWLPQLKEGRDVLSPFASLKLEQIALIDDQRANFQNGLGTQLLRYCKVARYDAHYRSFGFMENLGGIGAHSDSDYEQLCRFIDEPWLMKETFQVKCTERPFYGNGSKRPVKLVVFGFDETITLATFMPGDTEFRKAVGWRGTRGNAELGWTDEELVQYNFETPYVQSGSRVAKLRKLFEELTTETNGDRKALAILTRNENGAIAVLNLLSLAHLTDHLSAIWTISDSNLYPQGVFKEKGAWKSFAPPVNEVPAHKADVLHHVASTPSSWFPQLAKHQMTELTGLKIEEIVLVDDERSNFRSDLGDKVEPATILRFCKVARYDDEYRDCGHLNEMGGLGAHSDEDYESLKSFVNKPWRYQAKPLDVRGSSFSGNGSQSSIQSDDVERGISDALERSATPQDAKSVRSERTRVSGMESPSFERTKGLLDEGPFCQ